MPSQREFDKAMRLALLHDKLRKEVTESLRWALDTFEKFKERMPRDATLAAACHKAQLALRASERLTEGNQ